MPTPTKRTLRLAAETVGGEAALAEVLRVGVEQVRAWLGGENVPADVYCAALEIVARGPFNGR
ncbi:MAG TPA: YdaS family helix-turn-helix protein [Burkholderiales bacterium]|nr:YdaS family helix-turn-helix protein [Burkholderiales bacterium]